MIGQEYEIIKRDKFEYIDIESGSEGIPLVLLHGLMGSLSNFASISSHFKQERRIIVPILPIFTLPLKSLGVKSLVKYVESFLDFLELDKVHILGNSLGGHIAQLVTLENQERIASMTLTGSSGLFENAMGTSFPRRGNYNYIKEKAEMVFYDPKIATKELVDDVYATVNDIRKGIRVVITAKSAVRHNLEDKLNKIQTPTLLIWGLQDTVTPPWVGEKFHELIPNSKLVFFDQCGHAPMMEKPEEFNIELGKFLNDVESRN